MDLGATRLVLSAVDGDDGMDISPGVEVGFEADPLGTEPFLEGVKYLVGTVLVGDVAVDEGVDIEFDGFELYDVFVGTIVERDGGKIGIAGSWAATHKFREFDVDRVVFFVGVRPVVFLGVDVKIPYLFFTVFHGFPLVISVD